MRLLTSASRYSASPISQRRVVGVAVEADVRGADHVSAHPRDDQDEPAVALGFVVDDVPRRAGETDRR